VNRQSPVRGASVEVYLVQVGFGPVNLGLRKVSIANVRSAESRKYDESVSQPQSNSAFWWGLLVAIIVSGVMSRVAQTGFRVLDKYLGDALYAAMIYVVLRLTKRISRVALWAGVVMTALEFFQLTGVPAAMLGSGYAVARVCARLLGTQFSTLDLLAYAAGIGFIAALDRLRGSA
jgi:hypothetical protein